MMDYLRKLLTQKELEAKTSDDLEKIDTIKDLFTDDGIFFKMNIDTAYGILYFLGIPKDKIEETYMSLISPETYMKESKPYFIGNIQK